MAERTLFRKVDIKKSTFPTLSTASFVLC